MNPLLTAVQRRPSAAIHPRRIWVAALRATRAALTAGAVGSAAVAGTAVSLATPAAAESLGSSAASSVSSAGSAVSGSVSDSLKTSSGSSGGQAKVAQGPYRVLAVQALGDRPGMVELHLRPEVAADGAQTHAGQADAQDIWLRLPRTAMGPAGLVAGERVWAQARDYGLAFARGALQPEAPFYLVLNEGRQHDLSSRALSL